MADESASAPIVSARVDVAEAAAREGWERRAAAVQRSLLEAFASGDPAAIDRARTMAIELHAPR